ncbi:MFS transporter [Pseudooceanicola sp. LIPI14-2-Ac024]|uniref:MFS transporter n=1 Tax=Pseudooceanicola sp. LIPI14-2-Ac024 TaxID=3344875 RepID=UPI0035CEB59A
MTLIRTNPAYRLLFSASAASNLADGIAVLALPWLATLVTRDPALIALVAFATRLPWFLFSIPVGVLTDRADRRRLMAQSDLLRMLLSMGIVALIAAAPELPLAEETPKYVLGLAAIAFMLGCAEVVRDNAAQTMLPSIVDKAQLETANGQIWSVEQVMGAFVGPPLAGFLIALAVPGPFLLNTVAFGLAAWLVWMIAMPPRAAPLRQGWITEMAEGWRWLRGNRMLLRVAIMLGLINAMGAAMMTIQVLFAQEILGLGATGYGLLLTAGAAGGVIGGIWGPAQIARIGGQRAVWLALALMPVPALMIALGSNTLLVGLALFVEMLAGIAWNIVTVSWRQRLIPDALLGRVNALYRFFAWGMIPVGALVGGWIVSRAEPSLGREMALRLPYALSAVGFTVMAIYGRARLRLD